MVQRKADYTDNKPSSNNLKSSSSLHHNHVKSSVKPDLKKKVMKRSGSIKRQELETEFERRLVKGRAYRSSDSTPQKQQKDSLVHAMTPNYMKSTSSSIAKKEQSAVRTSSLIRTVRTLTQNPCFKSKRSTVKRRSKVVSCENMMIVDDGVVQKPTCSSTLKHCKFPAYLELSHGGTESSGTSVFKVCPYTYCSLNGHYHEPSPPLKLFLSAKRCAMKAQKGPKLGCVSLEGSSKIDGGGSKEEENLIQDDVESTRTDVITEFENMDCFKETEIGDQEDEGREEAFDQTENSEASDMELEMNVVLDVYDSVEYEYSSQTEIEPELKGIEYEAHDDKFLEDDDVSQDSTFVDSDAFSCSDRSETTSYDLESLNDEKNCQSDEALGEEEPMPAIDLLEDEYLTDSSPRTSGITRVDPLSFLTTEDQTSFGHSKDESLTNDADQTSCQEDSCENESDKAVNCDPSSPLNREKEPKPEIEIEARADQDTITANSRKPIADMDQSGNFSLRGPNFLPLEPDPDAEKVDLKHQEADERKNSEEFMVDYALRQAVTKLAPARKRKVELLVEAFEKVMPASKCEVLSRQSSSFDRAMVVQACN